MSILPFAFLGCILYWLTRSPFIGYGSTVFFILIALALSALDSEMSQHKVIYPIYRFIVGGLSASLLVFLVVELFVMLFHNH